MITKPRIKKLSTTFEAKLIGMQLPTNKHGEAGRAFEDIIANNGFTVNKGRGIDLINGDVEIKTRSEDATSAQSVAMMSIEDIKKLSYEESPVCLKFRRQLRVKLNRGHRITSAKVYNFDQPHIQDLIKQGYEKARSQIIADPTISYTPYSHDQYGYFEQCHRPKSTAFSFRLSNRMIDNLEIMSNTTFNNIFEYDV